MPPTLSLVRPNLHLVEVDTRQMLFHVPTSSLFELDESSRAVMAMLHQHEKLTLPQIRLALADRYGAAVLDEIIAEFQSLDVISDGRPVRLNPEPKPVTAFPLNTVVLNVNTGCNLSCTYCYKEDLTTPSKGQKMAFDTAAAVVSRCCCGSPRTNPTTTWCSSAASR